MKIPTMITAQGLRELYLQKKENAPSYSTRAFARDIGMSQTLLSLVMNGKRALSLKQAVKIAALLNMEPFSNSHQTNLFIDYEADRFKAISQWYYVAILDLSTTITFNSDPKAVAARLGISQVEARDALERLERLGFLEKKNGKLKKTNNKVQFKTQNSEPAVRNFHKQMLQKASEELDRTSKADFEARSISAVTMAIKPEKIKKAQKLINDFKAKMASVLTKGGGEEVYQLNVQFFPLTRASSGKAKT